MERLSFGVDREHALFATCLAAIAAHVVNVSVFQLGGTPLEKLGPVAAVSGAIAIALYAYSTLAPGWKAVVSLEFGLPALVLGAGMNGAHVLESGFSSGDLIGVIMIAGGLVLCVMGTGYVSGEAQPRTLYANRDVAAIPLRIDDEPRVRRR
jgi:hypothetical protein